MEKYRIGPRPGLVPRYRWWLGSLLCRIGFRVMDLGRRIMGDFKIMTLSDPAEAVDLKRGMLLVTDYDDEAAK